MKRLVLAVLAEHRYRVLLASTLFMIIGSGPLYLIVVALKPIAAEFGWPRSIPSLAFSLQFVGSGVGGIVMGYWLDRSGMGPASLVGALAIAGGCLLAGSAQNAWTLFFAYGVLLGFLGQGTLFAPLSANITRWFEQRRGFAVGIVLAGQSLSGALWPPVFRYINETVGWRQSFLWFGVLALLVMVPLTPLFWRRPPAPAAPRPGLATRIVESRSRAPLSPAATQAVLCAAGLGCCVAMAIPVAHIVSHVDDIGFSAARGAEMLAVMLALAVVSRLFLLGYLVDRLGGLRSLLVFSTAQAVTLAALAVIDGLAGLYVVAVLFGLGYGGVLPSYPIIVREVFDVRQAGRRTGIVTLFTGLGMAVGGWAGGRFFDATGSYDPAFLFGAAFNVANLVLIGLLITRIPRPQLRAAAG